MKGDVFLLVTSDIDEKLRVGDDFILKEKRGALNNVQIVTVTERVDVNKWRLDPYGTEALNTLSILPSSSNDPEAKLEFILLRSGNRNNLNAPGQNISALVNPAEYASVGDASVSTYLNGDNEAVLPITSLELTSDKVLSASVNEYSEKWSSVGGLQNFDACSGTGSSFALTFYTFDKFRNGARGIFRFKSSSSYRTDRDYYDGNNLKFAEERGTYNDFSLFDWKSPFYRYTDKGKKWLINEEITDYSKSGMAVESKNALSIYNSVILGDISQPNDPSGLNSMRGDRVTGVVTNGRRNETAFNSFENYEALSDGDGSVRFNNGELLNNVIAHRIHKDMFVPNVDNYQTDLSEVYNVVGVLNSLENTTLIFDKPFTENGNYAGTDFELYLDDGNSIREVDISISGIRSPREINNQQFTEAELICNNDVISNFNTGRLSFRRHISVPGQEQDGEFLPEDFSDIAHTGRQSQVITSTTDNCISSVNLDFAPNQKYVLSLWINSEDPNESNISDFADENVSVSIRFEEFGDKNAREVLFYPKGNRIDGWQRLEGLFELKNSAINDEDEIDICFNKGNLNNILVDDLRIFPEDALMKTYVYNPENQLLMAELDENNYFTKYIYNKGGELISILKETEDGVISLNESRSFLSPIDDE